MYNALVLSTLGALSVFSSVQATDSTTASSSSACATSLKTAVVVDASSFATVSFDYLIVGGGTAGLALAARLTENTSLKVGIIEAGIYHINDSTLMTPEFFLPGGSGNAEYDWMFKTTPQPGANGQNIAAPRGKMMGGSSGLNFLGWNRASQIEYDSWSTFTGSSVWSWSGLTSYFSKSQTVKQGQSNPFPGVSPATEAASFTHGSSNGPINVSYNALYTNITAPYVSTWNNLGVKTLGDADAGSTIGIWNTRASVDRTQGVRSYAATGYFGQACGRSNLYTLTGAEATKIGFTKTSAGYSAQNVTFTVAGVSFTARAGKEVIISAGSVKTPALLELSGIGNATLLQSLGITPLINLPSVGENMQEHVFSIAEFQLNAAHQDFDTLEYNATFNAEQTALYAHNRTGWLAANEGALAFATFQQTASTADQAALLAAFDATVASRTLTPIQKIQYTLQRDWIVKGTVPMTETILFSRGLIVSAPNESFITMLNGAQHPMARGSIHISTSNPTVAPTINGNYLDNDFDVLTILQGLKFLLKLGATAPLSSSIKALIAPTVTSDADLIDWIRNTLSTGSHIMGTAALATQAQGGVVDSTLTVYGTTNLRVVDASVIPFSIATHLQSTVYAIAEKAAAMILA